MTDVIENFWFGVTRILPWYNNRVEGYIVRLLWQDGVPNISTDFHMREYRSLAHCLNMALSYRDEQLALLLKSGYVPYARGVSKPYATNTSGVLGVSVTPQCSHGRKTDVLLWQACWISVETGKAISTKFSEKKWGMPTAKLLAIASRRAKRRVETLC